MIFSSTGAHGWRTRKHIGTLIRWIVILGLAFGGLVQIFTAASYTVRAAKGNTLSWASPLQPLAVINACGSITTSTTWTADNIYTANNCAITIPADVTLTIQSGTTVKFLGGQAVLIVNGSLAAQGTPAQPVTFSSIHDNAHGEAAPGSSGLPAAQDWYGLYFAPGSRGQISHAFIGYGSAYFNHPIVGWNKAQIFIEDATIEFANLEVGYGSRPGIYLKGSSENVQIADSFIHDHSLPSPFPYGPAIYQESLNMRPTYSNLTFSGNDRDQVVINVTPALTRNVSLGGADFGFLCGYTLCEITIPDGITFTVAADTTLDFRASYGIIVEQGGSFIAEGTPTQPITLTSQLAANGDANQYWNGLWAKHGSTLRLDYCDLSYANDGNFGLGGLEINTDDAQVNNCHIHHNKQNGLYIYSRAGTVSHHTLFNITATDNGSNGVVLQAGSGAGTTVIWDGGAIRDNGFAGMRVLNSGVVDATLKNIPISGNGKASGGYVWSEPGIFTSDNNVNFSLENLTITGNVGAPVQWNCNGSIRARNLTVSGNGTDALVLPGCSVSSGRVWDLDQAGAPVHVTGVINIPTGGLLSLQAGTELLFAGNTYLSSNAGSLYALGTADQPILMTRITDTQSVWQGVHVYAGTTVLRHTEIAYAGNFNNDGLYISGANTFAIVQNSQIHHSGYDGVNAGVDNAIFRYNEIDANAHLGMRRTWGVTPVDARYNWWGDPSGPYHATLNPTGLGNPVGDNVLFNPWLTTLPADEALAGEMLVSTGAPALISPGEMVDYSARYLNMMTTTVTSAALIIQLPEAAHYVDSTHGGLYWPERHQIFWKLGDLPPGATDQVSARVRFSWGLPANYTDGSLTMLVGSNYATTDAARTSTNTNSPDVPLTVFEYYAFEPLPDRQIVSFSQADFTALRSVHANLESLYQQAIGEGYTFVYATRVNYNNGVTVSGAFMVTANKKYVRFISQTGDRSLAMTSGPGTFTLHDTTGGMTADLKNFTRSFWGEWASQITATSALAPAVCGDFQCMYNCIVKSMGFGMMIGRGTALTAAVIGGPIGWAIAGGWVIFDVVDTVYTTSYMCPKDCGEDPHNHCCTPGETRWEPNALGNCGLVKCDLAETWEPRPDITKDCGKGFRCVAGFGSDGGCKPCQEEDPDPLPGYLQVSLAQPETSLLACALSGSKSPPCSELEVRRAKDPNAIYGPVGDVLPGETLAYTITYENEGAGRAYGVYVTNELPEPVDESTLDLHGNGIYLPETREIFWLVGELGPKGDPDSTGTITYSVQLKSGLPSGTVVSNQAVVNFSSVPEETPTNAWVNVVMPLAAEPQELTTNYATALSINLSGRDVSGLPLLFTVIEPPRGGVLSGAAPSLIYTPAANFTGEDSFTFVVTNGVSTSRPAQVRLTVTPTGDTILPQVLWAEPDDGQEDVVISVNASYTDTLGLVYPPAILVGFSEAIDPATVTTQTVTLEDESGHPVTIAVTYDPILNQLVIRLLQPLAGGSTYKVTLRSEITDLAGNPLAATPYTWTFDTAAIPSTEKKIYLPILNR